MNFDDFQNQFVKENRKLRILIGMSWLIFVAFFTLLVFEKKYFVYRGHPIFEERVLSESVCLVGFKSVLAGAPDPSTVSSGIIEILEKEPFTLAVEKIIALQSIEKGFCKLILENEGNLRSFKIGLSKDEANPFYYKVLSIDEIPAEES